MLGADWGPFVTVKRLLSASTEERRAVPFAEILGALRVIGGGLFFCTTGAIVGTCLKAPTSPSPFSTGDTGDFGSETDNSNALKLRFLRIGVAIMVKRRRCTGFREAGGLWQSRPQLQALIEPFRQY